MFIGAVLDVFFFCVFFFSDCVILSPYSKVIHMLAVFFSGHCVCAW
jgi:hypothetical protein